MSATVQTTTTLEQFYRLRDADPDPRNRYELIDGEVFESPAPLPPHQRVLSILYRVVDRGTAHVERVTLLFSPIDLRDGDRTVVQPDLLLLLDERTAYETKRDISGPPNLVVEILSPSTERVDRGRKLEFYARFGVDELWLADIARRTLSVCSDPVDGFYRSVVTFTTPGVARSATIPGLEVNLDDLFAVPDWLVDEEEHDD
jgi:Uma2 family endonuclease